MAVNKEYNLAVAFLQFKQAYQALVRASKDMPDHDVTEFYPFYLIDFEDIVEPVSAWCNVQSTKLLRMLPDKVDNPACLYCPDFQIGLGPDGLCKAAAINMCKAYPMIVFTKEQVIPIMQQHGIEVTTDETADEVYLKYMKFLEVLDVKRRESKAKQDKVEQVQSNTINSAVSGPYNTDMQSGAATDGERKPTVSIGCI